jgi:hypothetical protein
MATNTMATSGAPAASQVNDRCVAVVGMHRSGTSATAGLLVSLGLTGPKPDDLQPATAGNERGHFESKQMGVINSRLLRGVGGTWTALPPVTLRWDGIPKHAQRLEGARQWFATTYDGRPMVIKDPRLCMTLPFWRDALPAPMAAVLVLRKPLSVARSLEARDDMQMTLGLAIWDRSMRSADLVLEGLPTLVVNYDDMMADPGGTTEEFVRFLERVDVDVAPDVAAAAARQLDTGLRHQKAEDDEYRDFAGVQTGMFEALLERKGIHDAWKPVSSFSPPPLWVADTLDLQRKFTKTARQLRKLRGTMPNRIMARLSPRSVAGTSSS